MALLRSAQVAMGLDNGGGIAGVSVSQSPSEKQP